MKEITGSAVKYSINVSITRRRTPTPKIDYGGASMRGENIEVGEERGIAIYSTEFVIEILVR